MSFQSFVKELPNNCIVHIRIADNVLDEEDWPVHALIISDGVVTSQTKLLPGAYEIPSKVGLTTKQLCAWSHYDSTGSPVENYYEIQIILSAIETP